MRELCPGKPEQYAPDRGCRFSGWVKTDRLLACQKPCLVPKALAVNYRVMMRIGNKNF